MLNKFMQWLMFEQKPSPPISKEGQFLLSLKRWERKMDAQLSVPEGETGSKLVVVEAREEYGGFCHEEMFLKWDDGSLTVLEPDQWNTEMAMILGQWAAAGKPMKKIGRKLGPPLTKQEFEADYQKMFNEPAPSGLFEAACASTRS